MPTLRLEQDGSNGFAPQSWDVSGNVTGFYVRDVTHQGLEPGGDLNLQGKLNTKAIKMSASFVEAPRTPSSAIVDR